MSFTTDFSDFDKKFYKLVEKSIPGSAKKGLFKAMNEMLQDAKDETPRAPFLKGDLWGSTAGTTKAIVKWQEISVIGGFNISYASRLHEMEKSRAARTNWTLPGSGPKFLQSKMVRNKEKYMEVVALTIRNTRV